MTAESADEGTPATLTLSPGFLSALPPVYLPRVAGYARGPFIQPETVTPSDWNWRNARTCVVSDSTGTYYRCVRVSTPTKHGPVFVGYWAVELLGIPLPLAEWGD
jgi:hypothetical protein